MGNWIVGALGYLKDLGLAPIALRDLKDRVSKLEAKLAYVEIYYEIHAKAIQQVQELKALQDGQTKKLANLSLKVEKCAAILAELADNAPDEEKRQKALGVRHSLIHRTKAENRISVN